ncbi:Hypothetical protein POVR1_LOCUS529 [uncultured virus]|nr:Hypothetical protein POVR1_LOCUS529 [uncultured virus]
MLKTLMIPDLMNLITVQLNHHDLLSLRATSHHHVTVLEPITSERRKKCISEIEARWNYYADIAMTAARLRLPQYLSPHRPHEWIVREYDQLICRSCSSSTALENYDTSSDHDLTNDKERPVVHDIEVCYTHFPRDVDILEWGLNGKSIGYTML